MNTGEERAGMARRRCSPRLHPQIQASEEGTGGTTRRRSPRLHPQPQIQVGEIGAGLPHRRGTSPAEPCCMPDDDDMLREILMRLPPEPSSLPRASAVCRRWRSILTDPKFCRQFCAHHGKPPLLAWNYKPGIVFNPVLNPPERIPPVRFSLACHRSNNVLDCRHGLILVGYCHWSKNVVVCDPITGERHRVPIPPDFKKFFEGAVLSTTGNHGHLSPFKVVLISTRRNEPFARVYSSQTSGWRNLMSTPDQLPGGIVTPSTLIGNTLYWLCWRDRILEFDLDGQGLSVIMDPPVVANSFHHHGNRQIVQAEDGVVGFAILSYPHFQMWARNINGHRLATWVPWKTIEMDSILALPPQVEGHATIEGYEEDTDVIFLNVNGSVYMVELKSLQSKKLDGTFNGQCHPFRSFYTPAIRECDKADMLHGP